MDTNIDFKARAQTNRGAGAPPDPCPGGMCRIDPGFLSRMRASRESAADRGESAAKNELKRDG